MKKLLVIFCTVLLVLGLTIPASAAVNMTINGQQVAFQADRGQPFIDANYRTLVPLRGALEAFGATVDWSDVSKAASVAFMGVTVEVPLNQAYIVVNGQQVANDTTAVEKGGRIYLPIRAVLEAFGATVNWNEASQTVIVASPYAGVGTTTPTSPTISSSGELRGAWISFLEFDAMPKDQAGFQAAVDAMFDKCVASKLNAVFVQVCADCDAMYPSNYYPWSKFASGTQGVSPGYDPLAYMIQAAHARGLQLHAWLNPYRVTGYKMTWSEVSAASPAKTWLTDGDSANDRWVLQQNGNYYLNPSVKEVRQLIVNVVRELVQNYDVDGIHFDDYFYPAISSTSAGWFDKPEYDASGSTLALADWRRNNVNMLVASVHDTVKGLKPNVLFGISPAGNVSNLRSDSNHFVDIDTWLASDQYIDYIMPQLYWGFEAKTSAGAAAPWAYEANLQTWISLTKNSPVDLMVGLALYRGGTNIDDNNATSEWLRYHDIIARQVTTARATGQVSGYAFFRYGSFLDSTAQAEVQNLLSVL